MTTGGNAGRIAHLTLTLGLALASVTTQAAPVATSGPVAGDGDGLTAFWVSTGVSLGSVASALEALANGTSETVVEQLAPYIDYRDFVDGTQGEHSGPDLADPFSPIIEGQSAGEAIFAVRFSGFLNVLASGDYAFRSLSDDGFRLTLGGEVISVFDGNRSPDVNQVELNLEAGLYSIEFIGWEQGGQFVNELAWRRPGDETFHVVGAEIDDRVLFSQAPSAVPVPAALPLLGSALVGLGALGRRRKV
ncbi:MAG: PA14 domain-containing protein [Gammaproteobacteria bacterium]